MISLSNAGYDGYVYVDKNPSRSLGRVTIVRVVDMLGCITSEDEPVVWITCDDDDAMGMTAARLYDSQALHEWLKGRPDMVLDVAWGEPLTVLDTDGCVCLTKIGQKLHDELCFTDIFGKDAAFFDRTERYKQLLLGTTEDQESLGGNRYCRLKAISLTGGGIKFYCMPKGMDKDDEIHVAMFLPVEEMPSGLEISVANLENPKSGPEVTLWRTEDEGDGLEPAVGVSIWRDEFYGDSIMVSGGGFSQETYIYDCTDPKIKATRERRINGIIMNANEFGTVYLKWNRINKSGESEK